MNISVFGLGYVGCVSAACLANDGHRVIGVDVDSRKVRALAEGNAPFFEPGLGEMLQSAKSSGILTATMNEHEAIGATDAALVCVGTPSTRTGEVKLDALRGVMSSIGAALRDRTSPFVVILRSTVLPTVVEKELIPLLERVAGQRLGDNLHFAYNPEFLREGTAIRDFYEAPMIVVGHSSSWAGEVIQQIYSKVDAPIVSTDIGTACLVKYVCNAFHALKVSFANEVGLLSEALEVDGRKVMEIVCMDRKLNISPTYLKPGFAFGGSCLPKDMRAVASESRRLGISLPLLQSILPSNKSHLQSCIDHVLEMGDKQIGLFGLTFKEGTDDLRESAAVELAEALIGKGARLKIYEPTISDSTIYGANREYVERTIPHIWSLLTPDISDILKKNVVVLLKKMNESELEALRSMTADQTCIDFANALGDEQLEARTIRIGAYSPAPARI